MAFNSNLSWFKPLVDISGRALLPVHWLAMIPSRLDDWAQSTFFSRSELETENSRLNQENLVHRAQKTAWVDSVTASLSLDQKIAQFFMLGVYPTQGEANRLSVKKMIKTYHIGGVIFFKGHPSQIASWSNDFQKASKIPLFASIDGEWGINMRVDSTIQYPRQLTLGAIKDNDLIFQMGEQIGYPSW